MKTEIHHIDEVIHQKVRLGIMTILAARRDADFTELKQELTLSDGNLSTHLSLLEKHHYITIQKQFSGRKPQTTIAITEIGKTALKNYLTILRKIIES
ncbi:transcriptional regulator [bacterium]|nr:transcriptional regulator [bacterium]NUN45571.1 transcriptional regulator [bacterium]HMV27437.1 transcriptional regulator [bacterium]HMW32351.1 transcriptional regulator [bacterium]HMW35699.1 transcriptional regulator [bacterium]